MNIREKSNLFENFQLSFDELNGRKLNSCKHISILVSQPRTGSTMISDYLTKTGDVGWCDEWLNPIFFRFIQKNLCETSYQKTLKWILDKSSNAAGNASINIQIPHLVFWKGNGMKLLKNASRVSYLYRNNKIAQAISLVKAEKTKTYHNLDGVVSEAQLEMEDILEAIQKIQKWDKIGCRLIDSKKVLSASYESVVEDEKQINKILKFFNCEKGIDDLKETNLKIQRTYLDTVYEEKIRSYLLDGDLNIFRPHK